MRTDFKTRNKALLDIHMADKCERLLLFKCKLCGVAFDSDQNLKTHRFTHHGNTCEVCDNVYPTIAQLIAHRKSHKKKTFTCEYCSKSFSLHFYYLKHLSKHTGLKPFKCSACSKRFLRSGDRDNHEKNECQRSCPICHEKFARKSALSKHIARHGIISDIYTDNLNNRMNSGSLSLIALIGPNGELIHKCSVCAKLFGSEEEARRHRMQEHVSNFSCNFCAQTFKTSESKLYHMRMKHEGDRLVHICSKCGA